VGLHIEMVVLHVKIVVLHVKSVRLQKVGSVLKKESVQQKANANVGMQ
jgi:hypothetical protein